MNNEKTEAKVEKFVEEINDDANKSRIPILFCVNCGSINLDQNGTFQIKCYSCRQIAFWNGLKFSVARGGEPHDVLQMVTPAQEGYWDDWHGQINLALHDFGERLNMSPVELDSASDGELKKHWEKLKAEIDRFLT